MGEDVHDRIASHLSGVGMLIGGYASDAERGLSVDASDLREVQKLIQEGVAEARRISHGLNPVTLRRTGLSAALQDLAEAVDERGPARCTFDGPDETPDVGHAEEIHLFRIAQEAATNAARHAEARTIHLELKILDGDPTLVVEDDGKGLGSEFEPGLGIQSMRDRSDLIEASLTIDSKRGKGTRVCCRMGAS